MTPVKGVAVSPTDEWTDPTAAKKSIDTKLTTRGFSSGSSEGRTKSPGSTEDASAPPITLPAVSIAVLCQIRGFTACLSESSGS